MKALHSGHFAFVVIFWFYFPDFFHSNTKFRHVTVCIQIKFGNHLFRKWTACSFWEEHIFSMQFHAWLIGIWWRSIRVFPKFTSDNTFDFAIIAIFWFADCLHKTRCIGFIEHCISLISHFFASFCTVILLLDAWKMHEPWKCEVWSYTWLECEGKLVIQQSGNRKLLHNIGSLNNIRVNMSLYALS